MLHVSEISSVRAFLLWLSKAKTGQKSHIVTLVLVERGLKEEPFVYMIGGMSAPCSPHRLGIYWCISTKRDEFLGAEGSFPVEVSWEGVTPREKLIVPFFELELASGSPASQAEVKSFPQGGSGLPLAGPRTSWPGLRNWKEPTEGHPFKPVPAPGTLPSVPDSRAMSSATRRLTTACQSTAAPAWHRPMCLYSSCLCSSPLPLRSS